MPATERIIHMKRFANAALGGFLALLSLTSIEAAFTGPVGPQSSITCPAGAVPIALPADIQTAVNTNPGNTTFCIKAGVRSIQNAITPKSGDTFVGEYGAILDGTGWTTPDNTQGAFRAWNEDIDDVTIRNLVIRNMPQRGVNAFRDLSDRWTIEYNEIAGCKNLGVNAPSNSIVRNNYIHHNISSTPNSPTPSERGGGYGAYRSVNTSFINNEIAYNGPEQKICQAINVKFQSNYVHHNNDGIWYDCEDTSSLIEDNLVEDNAGQGIFYEISGNAIIRNNTVRRSGESGIFISNSKDTEVYGNRLEDNFRGVNLFLDCNIIGQQGTTIAFDLANNTVHDNIIKVGTASGALASGFSYLSSCTSAQVGPYVNGSKNLTFTRNSYFVPTLTGRYWYWGGVLKTWAEWQAIPQDATGTLQLASEYVPGGTGSVCDVNRDAATNVTDVQLCANQAIGAAACGTGDINKDSTCNVVDVQRVVNAALGGLCVSP